MKYYITFGQAHTHKVNGKVFDYNCVAVIDCKNAEEGDKIVVEVFGRKFCYGSTIKPTVSYFPHGLISLETEGAENVNT